MMSWTTTPGCARKSFTPTRGWRRSERARFARVEQLIAESIAKDLDAAPGDIRPVLVAASVTAAFTTLRDRVEAESGEAITHEQTMAIIDDVLEFLRGGPGGLRRTQ